MTPYHKEEYCELLELTAQYIQSSFPKEARLVTTPSFYDKMLHWHRENNPQPSNNKQPNIKKTQIKPPPSQVKAALEKSLNKPKNIEKEKASSEKHSPKACTTPPKIELKSFNRSKTLPLQNIWTLVAQHFPKMKILDSPPDDTLAKKIGSAWKHHAKSPEIIILSSPATHSDHNFLSNLNRSIDDHLLPAMLCSAKNIDQQNAWDKLLNLPSLKLLLISKTTLQALSNLQPYYSVSNNAERHYLGRIPIFFIKEPSQYLTQPELKPLLWKSLTQWVKKKSL